MSLEEYNTLLQRQGGVCAICKDPPGKKNLDVDHDHSTGKIRGLLCTRCNLTLGRLKDDLTLTRSAASYLLRHDPCRSWDSYFLNIAELVATRSKDPSTQVGAVLVSNRAIISTGYNGFPRGVNDRVPERFDRPMKYLWTIHAEENAILNAARHGVKLEGSSLYITPLPPCTECAKAIAQAGLKEVIFSGAGDNERLSKTFNFDDSLAILRAAKILVRPPE